MTAAKGPQGYDVTEEELEVSEVGIVPCTLVTETRWQCPGCKGRFAKLGVHSGRLKTCGRCGASFFLRR